MTSNYSKRQKLPKTRSDAATDYYLLFNIII